MTVGLRFKVKKQPPVPPYPKDLGLIRVVYEIGVFHGTTRDGCFVEPDEFVCAEQTVPEEDVEGVIPFLRAQAFELLTTKVVIDEEETEG